MGSEVMVIFVKILMNVLMKHMTVMTSLNTVKISTQAVGSDVTANPDSLLASAESVATRTNATIYSPVVETKSVSIHMAATNANAKMATSKISVVIVLM